ncbi:MFS transporter [Acinetobacter equi]|uniref:MFS transporter n=1 Tax=Acinetobacter equi TaxID=1324350 RepID=A0A0N9V822_9GAMM|nr:MFS transporter [Acinetobacter equi]ALH95330.1 MFS transporter [Acinetobacter equi]
MVQNPREEMNNKNMNGFQWFVIFICILLNVIDGFDVLVMAFTAASVSNEWGLSGAELGALLSAGLFGMGAGSLFLAPWADKIGRRPLILLCLLISGLSMVAASFAQTAMQLGLMRFITGIGIGGILASSNVIASEYASSRWRSLAVSLQCTGYAIGATVGGIIAIALISSFGWRSVFLTGGLTTLFMFIISYVWLPESLDYLLAKQPKNALNRINVLTQKINITRLTQLPIISQTAELKKSGISRLFSPRLAFQTICIWLSFFFVMFGFYFVMSWTPKILSANGMTTEQGVTAGVLISAGGMFGAALLGFISSRVRIFYVQAAFLALTAVLIWLFVGSTASLTIAFILSVLLGMMANGCVAGLYAMSPSIYEADVRATGVGYAIGFGRIGGILSPLVAGAFLDSGISSLTLYGYYGGAFILAIITVLAISKIQNRNTIKVSYPNSIEKMV